MCTLWRCGNILILFKQGVTKGYLLYDMCQLRKGSTFTPTSPPR